MEIQVGTKYKQVKAIEEYGFNYIGKEFEITYVDEKNIKAKCSFGIFGIEREKFFDYFEIIPEEKTNIVEIKNNIKTIRNDRATIVILPNGIKGVSKCMPQDKYDANKGYKIAYLKANIKSMQKELKVLSK